MFVLSLQPALTTGEGDLMTTKPFDLGLDPDLNACVGNNTGSDDDHGYVTGFGQAALALIATAKQQAYVDPDSNEEVTVYMDALIYPIGFCARHHIELFLKRQIARVSSLRATAPMVLDSTHELDELLATLKELCARADRRLPALLAPLETAVAEFARVDPTGQVFRYRKSTGDETHLADVGLINLQVLGKGFAQLFAAGQEFELVAEAMTYEYGQGTYTDKLSREDLRAVAEALPPRSTWKKSTTFASTRKGLMQTYGLSGRDFTRAINVIEWHHELAATIDAHRPLADVDPATLERLAAMEFDEAFLQGIGERTWKALDAIYEVGHIDVYSELYAHRMKELNDPTAGRIALPPDVARYIVRSPDRFRRGLKKLGQPHLVSSFDRGIAKRNLGRGAKGQKAFEKAAAAYENQVRRFFFGELPSRSPKYA
jgi:hypothetical protein